jgi:oligoendopeptidase F
MQETLPKWDLRDFYVDHNDPALQSDKSVLLEGAKHFAKKYRSKIVGVNAKDLYSAICEYEDLQELSGKISSYADLLFSTQTTNSNIAKIYQDIGDIVSEAQSELVFFELEINYLPEETLQKMLLENINLQRFEPWLRDVRAGKAHLLAEDLEKILLEKQTVSNSAWLRLYEDISNRMQIEFQGEIYNLAGALDLLSDKNPDIRQGVALKLSEIFNDKIDNFALIYNTIIKDKQINDKWRNFPRPISSRNLSNLVEDEIVDSLISTVSQNYLALSERYYLWKAKQFGRTQLDYWDRNAPLPFDNDVSFDWEQSKQIVLQAYGEFSPQMADIAKQFFENNWIDAPVYEGKTSGAFSHPTATKLHPYILLNHQGKMRDVMTLAHELGHGVHQMLSRGQGSLMADTPLTLAETASVFGEQLTFQYLLKSTTNPAHRTQLIASKVEDMLNTVVRQIAFCQFETKLHEMRAHGELTHEQIYDIWISTQSKSFGSAINLGESYRPYWVYISHFFHSPFYVYAYAFGDCLVNSLYAIYESDKSDDFVNKYIKLLEAGGTLRHKELLAPFGIDIAQGDFWQKGLNYIAKLIDLLHEM